jgi:translocation and assembly module TamB
MRRTLKVVRWALATILTLVVLAVAALFIVPNTGAGARMLERVVASATSGQVVIQGLSGRFPDALRVAHLDIRDQAGSWLTIDDAALDWSPLRLLRGEARIDRLAASRVAVARLPQSLGGTGSSGASSLPVTVSLGALHVARLELAAPVAGVAAALAVDGTANLTSLSAGDADVTISRLDGDGRYHLAGRVDAAHLTAALQATEPTQGLISTLAGLPDLGAIALTANVDGLWTDAVAQLDITAGPLKGTAHGQVNVTGQSAVVDITADAPAMAPRPDLSWQSATLRAHVSGPLSKPAATGALRLNGLAASGATLATLSATLSGDAAGRVSVDAVLDGLHLPGPHPDLFAAAPIRVSADADLNAADRPITLDVSHPLLGLTGTVHVGGDLAAELALTVADLSPFGVDIQGHTSLQLAAARHGDVTNITVTGGLGITGGMAPVPALVGPNATLAASATLTGSDIALTQLQVNGSKLSVDAKGGLTGGQADLESAISLSDLAVLAPNVQGAIQAQSHITGPTDKLTLAAELTGEVATTGFPRSPIRASVQAHGLPGAPAGTLTANATLEGAPLQLAASVEQLTDGTMHVTIGKADWKTAHAEADVSLPPGGAIPHGHLVLSMARLEELRPFLGPSINGSVTMTADIDARDVAHMRIETKGIAPTETISLQGDGKADAMVLKLAVAGAGVTTNATGLLNMPARQVTLSALQADYQTEHVTLLSPARLSFGNGVSVDRLRLGVRQAVLDLAGRLTPALDITASIRNLPAALASVAVPGIDAEGVLQADARLTGNPTQPTGTVTLSATGLHLRNGPAAAFPPASITATAALSGGRARLDAAVKLGPNQLTVTGTAPMTASGTMDLHTRGTLDLALLNPLLASAGRRVTGEINLDAGVSGTLAAPRLDGTIRLAGGEVQDVVQGVRIHDIQALIRATGDTIRIERFDGKAGTGTISVAGQVGVAAPMPVDVRITARNASPLASDKLTATMDSDLTVRGDALGAMAVAGTVKILHAMIRVPERLPMNVAVLNVRRPNDKPPPPPAPPPNVSLDVTISATDHVIVRGRGLDADMQGSLHIGGTAAAPLLVGGFKLRRGQFNLVGQTLNFSRGLVSLDGSGKIDPTLDFIATTTTSNITATLGISGYASAPKITLSSSPQLPQDEILAQLLFGKSAAKLGAVQLVQIAAALAQITGLPGSSGLGALDTVRQGLGLDRLTVGSGQGGSGVSLEAGRYVAPGVYVGAKQDTSGAGSQAVVQVDLWRGLKLQTTVGTANSAATATPSTATTESNGNSVGLTWQFDY